MRTYVLAVVHAAIGSIVAPFVLCGIVAFIAGFFGYYLLGSVYVGLPSLLILNLVAVYLSPFLTMRFISPHISPEDGGNFLLISTLCFLIMNMFFFILPLPAMTGYIAFYLINAFIATGIFYYRTTRVTRR